MVEIIWAVLSHPIFALTVYPLLAFVVALELLDDRPRKSGGRGDV